MFQGVIDRGRASIPALSGLAEAQFAQKDFKAALASYQALLRLDPDMKPDIRLPIGVCYAKLSLIDNARAAFKRVIEQDPDNATALTLLSIMDFNLSRTASLSLEEKEKNRKSSYNFLTRAYKLDQRNPLVCNQMAERFIQKNVFDKVNSVFNIGKSFR